MTDLPFFSQFYHDVFASEARGSDNGRTSSSCQMKPSASGLQSSRFLSAGNQSSAPSPSRLVPSSRSATFSSCTGLASGYTLPIHNTAFQTKEENKLNVSEASAKYPTVYETKPHLDDQAKRKSSVWGGLTSLVKEKASVTRSRPSNDSENPSRKTRLENDLRLTEAFEQRSHHVIQLQSQLEEMESYFHKEREAFQVEVETRNLRIKDIKNQLERERQIAETFLQEKLTLQAEKDQTAVELERRDVKFVEGTLYPIRIGSKT